MEQITVILNKCGGGIEKFSDIATTIMAREYKGPNNYGFNGVIEIRSEDSNQTSNESRVR